MLYAFFGLARPHVSHVSQFIYAYYCQLHSSSCPLSAASCLLCDGVQFMFGQVISLAFL
jgi:hypothetical protein